MEDHLAIGWGFKLFKFLLVVLIIAAAIFIVAYIVGHSTPDQTRHRRQLVLLQAAFNRRTDALVEDYDRRIEEAPNEVLSIKYQQEKTTSIEEARMLYFADRQAILEGRHEVIEEHWSEELSELDPAELQVQMLE